MQRHSDLYVVDAQLVARVTLNVPWVPVQLLSPLGVEGAEELESRLVRQIASLAVLPCAWASGTSW